MKPGILFTASTMLLLTACGGNTVKETLGIGHKPPDEFRVVSRPPLSVPPQFNLRPPATGTQSQNVITADKKAQSIITGSSSGKDKTGDVSGDDNVFDLKEGIADTAVTPVDSVSLPPATAKNAAAGESQFLKNIGVDKADPKVRDALVQQKLAAQEKREEASWWNVLSTPEKKETLVDAKAEAKRIQDNKAENKPVTEGETPEVKDKDHGILGNIFGW
jgi:hypothetical protein